MQKKVAHHKLALAASRKGYRVQIHITAAKDNLRLIAPNGIVYATTLKLDSSKGYTEESVNEAICDIRELNSAKDVRVGTGTYFYYCLKSQQAI